MAGPIGSRETKIDARDKVTGTLRFVSDMRREGMLWAEPVLSTTAHAWIRDIDDRDARPVPGYAGMYTAADVPCNRVGFRRDHPVICDDKVRFFGDVVAVVTGETRRAAEMAARRIRVRYEELPVIGTLEVAQDPACGLVHEELTNNICHRVFHEQGNLAAGFSAADRIVEGEYAFGSADHCFLETESGLSYWEDGQLVVCAGSQNVFYDRSQVALGLGMPEEDVRILAPFSGGAFGGKGDVSVQILIGLVTLRTKRPCKMVFSRKQRFVNGVKRHPGVIRMKTGATKDGILTAHEVAGWMDTGAYTVFGDVVLEIATECCCGGYRIPHSRVETVSLYTNNGSNGAFRGFGAAQGCYALESQMARLARSLAIDPIEFRRRNCLEAGEVSGMGHTLVTPTGLREVLEASTAHPLWQDRGEIRGAGVDPWVRGVGFACATKGYGIGVNDAPDYGYAGLEVEDGSLVLNVGANDLGQGSYTALRLMAARELDLEPDRIRLRGADTRHSEETGPTAASRVTYAVGRAVCDVSRRFLKEMRARAAVLLGGEAGCLSYKNGVFSGPGGDVDMEQLVRESTEPISLHSRLRAAYSDTQAGGGLGHPHVLYSANGQVASVMVNTETGEVYVDRMAAMVDVGRCIHPPSVEGQSEGGVLMGISYALLEKLDRADGKPLQTSFATYLLPTTLDAPEEIDTWILEVPEPTGPYGAKGMAENATVPTAPAVVDAINDALGLSLEQIPVTPEALLRALEERDAR